MSQERRMITEKRTNQIGPTRFGKIVGDSIFYSEGKMEQKIEGFGQRRKLVRHGGLECKWLELGGEKLITLFSPTDYGTCQCTAFSVQESGSP